MIFSVKQIQKIIEIIDKNQAVFIGSQLGFKYLTPYQKIVLKSYGIEPDKFKNIISEIDRVFYFGMMAQTLGGLKSFKVKDSEFEKWFRKKYREENNVIKDRALEYVKSRAFSDLTNLGERVKNNLSNRIHKSSVGEIIDLDKEAQKKTEKAIEKNKTIQELASELQTVTSDWSKDFSRMADFIMQEAYGLGRAQQISDDHGGNVDVYKQTFPGVCEPCIKNYGLPGQEPKIYKLKELLANGNNIGRREQIPVVGNAHPWARSILHVIPEGSEWDNDKKKFVLKRNTQGVKRSSKVKVKITP